MSLQTNLRSIAAATSLACATATVAQAQKADLVQWDAASKTVTFHLIAGYNGENGGANMDGYASGDGTLTVPTGANVVVDFQNKDTGLAHSLQVVPLTDPLPDNNPAPAFAGAAVDHPDVGVPAPGSRTVKFVANKSGKYALMCGVQGHALIGMWMHFDVVDGATPTFGKTKGA